MESLQPFAIAFVIGLLIGIERERSHPAGSQAMGVRTFALLALLGTLAAQLHDERFSIIISLFVFATILLSYFRTTESRLKHQGYGITTEISAGLVYCLGFLTPSNPLAAAIVGAAILFTLLGRKKLHAFSRHQLKSTEIHAAIIMVIIGLGVLPFLPNTTVDPWQLLNPRKFGNLVFAIAGIQFSSYVAMRVFGSHLGMLLTGFFGGIVSSTAVFATLPKTYKTHPLLLGPIIAAALAATVAKLAMFFFVIFIASTPLAQAIAPPILVMVIIGIALSLILARNSGRKVFETQHSNPLDLKSVLKLAGFISIALIGISIVNRFVGPRAMELAAFLVGFFELHSVSFAIASIFSHDKIPLVQAEFTLALALLASFIMKFILLLSQGRNRFTFITSLLLLFMISVGAEVFLFNIG